MFLNEESVSSGSEWVLISTRDDQYNKGMNGMNSTKVSDIEDQMNGHAHIYRHRGRGGGWKHGKTIGYLSGEGVAVDKMFVLVPSKVSSFYPSVVNT